MSSNFIAGFVVLSAAVLVAGFLATVFDGLELPPLVWVVSVVLSKCFPVAVCFKRLADDLSAFANAE